jgi:hypothetical protein
MMAKYGEPGWTDSYNEWLRSELAAKQVPPEVIDRAMVGALSEVLETCTGGKRPMSAQSNSTDPTHF